MGGRCEYVVLTGDGQVGQTMLEARCLDQRRTWWDTTLDLNKCIGMTRDGAIIYKEE